MPLPHHTPLSRLPAGEEIALSGFCWAHCPAKGSHWTPGIELRLLSWPQELCLQSFVACPSPGASPRLSSAGAAAGRPFEARVCMRVAEEGI